MSDASQLQGFFELARTLSAEQLRHHARLAQVAVLAAGADDVATRSMSAQILVAGVELEVLFGLHFRIEDAERMLACRMGGAAGSRDLAVDLVRELSNLTSGRLKALLEGAGIGMAQGLPFVLRGKSFAPAPSKRRGVESALWALAADVATVYCSMTVVVKNVDILPKLGSVSAATLPSSGDVEVF